MNSRVWIHVQSLAVCGLMLLAFAKPTLAQNASQDEEKSAGPNVVWNAAKDIAVLIPADEEQELQQFFQSRHLLVGAPATSELKKAMEDRKQVPEIFANYSSKNDDPEAEAQYGSFIQLNPLSDEVVQLINDNILEVTGKEKFTIPLVLEYDEETNSYTAVGIVNRHYVGFFAQTEKVAPDDFAPADLRFKAKDDDN